MGPHFACVGKRSNPQPVMKNTKVMSLGEEDWPTINSLAAGKMLNIILFHINGLVQDCHISSALAMEIL